MNNTGIRLEVEQITHNGELMFKVTKIKALRAQELPREYLFGDAPIVFQTADGILQTDDMIVNWIRIGTLLSKSKLQHLLTHIRVAGNHLTRVNKKLKEKRLEQERRTLFVDGREVKKTQKNKAPAIDLGSAETMRHLYSLCCFEKCDTQCTTTELKMRREYERLLKTHWEEQT